MSNKLFLGNLNFGLTETDLHAELESLGVQPIQTRILRDRETQRSRGCGFVTVGVDLDWAITNLNGQLVWDLPLRVSQARAPGAAVPALAPKRTGRFTNRPKLRDRDGFANDGTDAREARDHYNRQSQGARRARH